MCGLPNTRNLTFRLTFYHAALTKFQHTGADSARSGSGGPAVPDRTPFVQQWWLTQTLQQ